MFVILSRFKPTSSTREDLLDALGAYVGIGVAALPLALLRLIEPGMDWARASES